MMRKYKLHGKTALVTGGGSGIGRLLSLKLASQGVRVVIWDVQKDLAEQVTSEVVALHGPGSCSWYWVDLCDRQQVYSVAKQTIADLGFVEIIVNNAGIVTGKTLLEATDAQIQRTFDVNVMCHFWIIRAFLPAMLARDEGYIVNIASSAGLAGIPKLVDYCASKHAAVGLNESLRLELARLNSAIHTTVVCPYYIDTGMFDGVPQTSMWGLLRKLKPDGVASRIVEAMRHKEPVLVMPSTIYLGPLVKLLFPPHICDWIARVSGVASTMDTFQGRQPRQ